MRTARGLFLLATAVALAACSDNASVNPTGPKAGQAANFDKNSEAQHEVIMSVTGHAEYDVTATPGIQEKYEVTAERRADGRVTGELELKQTRNGEEFRIHGTMVCVTVQGNLGRLAARVDRSTLPVVHAGDYLVWSVMQNDAKGREGKPDYSTEFFLYDRTVAEAHCDVGVNVAPFYPVKGDLDVRNRTAQHP